MLWIYFLIQIKFDCNQNVDGYALEFDLIQIKFLRARQV